MSIDLEGAEMEGWFWKATGQLRWYRPKGGHDTDIVLQMLWERATGERDWRLVPTIMED